MSFTSATSNAPRSRCSACMKQRPMRPKPLIPMRTFAMTRSLGVEGKREAGERQLPLGVGLVGDARGDEGDNLGGEAQDLGGLVALGAQLLEDGLGKNL